MGNPLKTCTADLGGTGRKHKSEWKLKIMDRLETLKSQYPWADEMARLVIN